MVDNNSVTSRASRPKRAGSIPVRFQTSGEAGAAAGHGLARTAMPPAVGISAPRRMSREMIGGGSAARPPLQPNPQASTVDRSSSVLGGRRASPDAVERLLQECGEGDDSSLFGDDEEAELPAAESASLSHAAVTRALLHEASTLPGSDEEDGDIVVEDGPQPETEGSDSASSGRIVAKVAGAAAGATAAPAAPAARKGKHPLQASIDRAMTLPYTRWSTALLQKTCSHRGISKMSNSKDRETMEKLLRGIDAEKKWCSDGEPYRTDLHLLLKASASKDKAAVKETQQVDIPMGCLMAFRNARMVGGSAEMPETYRYANKNYRSSDILAALAESDMTVGPGGGARASPSSDRPSSSPSSSSGRRSAGYRGRGAAGDGSGWGSDGVDTCEVVNVGRKTRHCLMRVIGIMMEDDVRPLVMESRLSMTRAELDTGETGANRGVWKVITTRYKDPNHTVAGSATTPLSHHVTRTSFHSRTLPSRSCTPCGGTPRRSGTPSTATTRANRETTHRGRTSAKMIGTFF